MTPKEKAKELLDNMTTNTDDGILMYRNQYAKECALIAVDEILKDKEIIDGMRVINDPYWQEVRQELEKL